MSGWFPRLLVVTATTMIVVFMLRPLLTYQALAVGASTAQLGLVVASFSVVSLAASIPIGRGIDRRGERGYLLVGAALIALTVLLLAAASDLWVIVVGSAALGLGQLLAMIACQTIIANGRDEVRRDARFATFTLVTSATQFAAPAIAGFLIADSVGGERGSGMNLTGVYLLIATVAFVGVVAAGTLLWRPGALSVRPQHFGKAAPGAIREVVGERSVVVALVVGFAVLSAADLLVAFMPAYGEENGVAPQIVGMLIAAHGLASVVVRIFLMPLLRRYTRRALLTVCLAVAALSLAWVPFVTWMPGLFLLMLLSGAGIGLCQPIAIGWVAGAVRPEVRGTAMSVRMAGNRLGQTLVPLGVAALAGAAGVAAAFVGPAALLLGAGGLVFWARAEENRNFVPGEPAVPPDERRDG